MYKCPDCQNELIQENTNLGPYFWCLGGHGVAIAMGVFLKFIDKPISATYKQNTTEASYSQMLCVCCRNLMQIALPLPDARASACFRCRFFWFDHITAKDLLPKKSVQNEARNRSVVLATVSFENKVQAEEAKYQTKITENLLQFLILLPVSAKKFFVKPLLRMALFFLRRR